MRVAVLGAGRMGLLHARLLREFAAVDELILADVSADRARAAAEELDARALVDPLAALDAADAAVIATPPQSHAALVRAAIERGCAVLCEKPLAETAGEAAALAADVEAAGSLLHVGFQRRFDPAYREARVLVESGALGRLFLLRLQGTEPVLPRSPKTNLLRNTAVHDFDLVRWLSGSEVASIYVEGSDRAAGRFDVRLDPDTIVATLRLTDGTLASLTTSRLSALGYDVRAELVGSNDHVAVGWSPKTPIRSLELGASPPGAERWQRWQVRFEDAYRNELEAFLAAVAGADVPAATVWDAVAAQRIGEAARRSLESGRRVVLEAKAEDEGGGD